MARHSAMLVLLIAGLSVLLIAGVPDRGRAQTDERCFAETGFCMTGRIREYWEQNGGLPVFGYPIGPQQAEDVEGQTRQVQWFERNRLELHPENQPPYDVLLGRLGVVRLRQQDRDWRAFPQSTSQADCRFFAETGHTICGEFLRFWQSNGLEFDGAPGTSVDESLALFGLPLSDAYSEQLDDGRSSTIQWFERARFELHPENQPPYNVLLGLLGREVRAADGIAAPPPAPTPQGALPVPPADAVSQRLRVPDGFAVRGFTDRLANPRLMTVGPDGVLYVAERGDNRVIRLPDANRDGRADGQEIILDNLSNPHSLEWINNCLYVAESNRVSRHCDTNGDGSLDQHSGVVDLPIGGNHTTRTLHAGPDGKLYVSVGSTCNACREENPQRAAILRFNLDGSIPADNPFANDPDPRRRAVWAEGLRNSIDFIFLPEGQLWANHNGRDGLSDPNQPLEETVINVLPGRHHGWPYCISEPVNGPPEPGPGPYVEVPDPSGSGPPPPAGFSCADVVPALFTNLAHSAPIGMTRYDAAHFPAAYRGDLFIALHGSWDRVPPAPCRVVRIRVEDGQPVASEDFLTGFQSNPNQMCGNAWGRPAGVVVGADGALYVSDDRNGRIYRIVRQ